MSTSDPELISAETLFSNRAKVTFFSSFGSFNTRVAVFEWFDPEASEKVVSLMSLWSESWVFIPCSDMCISSSKLTFDCAWVAAGDTRWCRICSFSAAFFFTGVELLRFFLGEGDPVRDETLSQSKIITKQYQYIFETLSIYFELVQEALFTIRKKKLKTENWKQKRQPTNSQWMCNIIILLFSYKQSFIMGFILRTKGKKYYGQSKLYLPKTITVLFNYQLYIKNRVLTTSSH